MWGFSNFTSNDALSDYIKWKIYKKHDYYNALGFFNSEFTCKKCRSSLDNLNIANVFLIFDIFTVSLEGYD